MKIFEIEIRTKFSNIEKGREIPEILKEPLRTLVIGADSEKDAVEKVKQEMLKTTYRQFFPDLNDRTDDLWFCSWKVQHLFPEHIVYENGEKMVSEWEEKDIIEMSESFMKSDIFERVEIKVK